MSTGLKKKHLRHVSAALREARDLMNSGGRHWIKGAERMLVDPESHEPGAYGLKSADTWAGERDPSLEPAYCSVGALHEVEADWLAAVTLAEVIDPAGMRKSRERLREDAVAEYRMELQYYGRDLDRTEREFVEEYVDERLPDAAEDVIVDFNDAPEATWADVRAAFTKAAKRLADRARARKSS